MDNKTIIEILSKRLGHSKTEISNLIDGLTFVVKDKCSDLDTIAVPGFGSFESKKRLERIANHPATGKRMLIPPKISVCFKPSALLKQKLKTGENKSSTE